MNPARPLFLLCLFPVFLLLAARLPAQSLIDFGSAQRPTGKAKLYWNDVTPALGSAALPLVDAKGFTTGVTLQLRQPFRGVGIGGTRSAATGSRLEQLGYPASAYSDYLWGTRGAGPVSIVLSGLDRSASYDIDIFASRMGVRDVRSGLYDVLGATRVSVVLDAALNQGRMQQVRAMKPDAQGHITIKVSTASSNTNPAGYFYLSALGLSHSSGSSQPQRLGFFPRRLDFLRTVGSSPYAHQLDLRSSPAANLSVQLKATDSKTKLPPTWLALAASGRSGKPIPISVGGSSLAAGSYRAVIEASRVGYRSARLEITLTVRPAGGARNLLWYGNSFTMGNATVSDLMRRLAKDMGEPEPVTVTRLAGGRNLSYHLKNPYQAEAIRKGLPLGGEWDYVILQGHSVEATKRLGNPDGFIADAKAILTNVRKHSPRARVVMFQTWARAQGHRYYLGSKPIFANPMVMHGEIAQSYRRAVQEINRQFGVDTARLAAVGDTAMLVNFAPSYYASDLYHAGRRITTLAAMAIYSAIYQKPVAPHLPNFQGQSELVARLKSFGMKASDWQVLSGLADRVGARSLRAFPGSDEDLLLRSAVSSVPNPTMTAVARKGVQVGQTLYVELSSPAGSCDQAPALLLLTGYLTGHPPAPIPGLGELHLDPKSFLPVAVSASLNRLSWQFPMSQRFSGVSFLFQGVALRPSARMKNPLFSATDAHELRAR
ncbi:MAG: hypothetical protein CSA62_01595 [Planctomycetota bacterium]|nr:MAG: hypothetical protein CSA62_01595 [Planctomycetota bacterium]